VEGDLFLHDIGQGFGFRPGTFDGAIRWVESALPFITFFTFPTSRVLSVFLTMTFS
jgi:hypothetical protein